MKKTGLIFIPFLLALTLCSECVGADGGSCAGGGMVIKAEAGGQTFPLCLEANETARAFEAMLPITLEMADLNANEKYHNLRTPLPSSPEDIGTIRAGDVMLFGDDCIVLFYKSFSTSYRYTRIGRIEDVSTLESAVGRGSITVSFDK